MRYTVFVSRSIRHCFTSEVKLTPLSVAYSLAESRIVRGNRNVTVTSSESVRYDCISEVETPEFARLVAELVDDADLRASMTAAARAQNTANAAQAVADITMAAIA